MLPLLWIHAIPSASAYFLKSSSGEYFIGLDHVRALAAFMVFAWHFITAQRGQVAGPPIFPLSILAEGHTGVALFMTLSGYLFAKLTFGREIDFRLFWVNRAIRLLPLLLLMVLVVGIQTYLQGKDVVGYAKGIIAGAVLPSLPNGGWSITTEFHFYLLFPLMLWLLRKWRYALLAVVGGAILFRLGLHLRNGESQSLAYWTIIGRIDQFSLGIVAFQLRDLIVKHKVLVFPGLFLFLVFYWYFDRQGGFYMQPSYPSPSPVWVIMPTVEGLSYGLGIAWYDNCVKHSTGKVSRFVAAIGTYSYSIYLLHFFFVFEIANAIHRYAVPLTNLNVALLMSVPGFLLVVPIGFLSYRLIEKPFLRFRVKYSRVSPQNAPSLPRPA